MSEAQKLVEDIRSNRCEDLWLLSVVRFRRRTRNNSSSFDHLLEALRCNHSISYVVLTGPMSYGITQDEWYRLIETLGMLQSLTSISFCDSGGPMTVPLGALAVFCQQVYSRLTSLRVERNVILFGTEQEFQACCTTVARSPVLENVHWLGTLRLRNHAIGCFDYLCQHGFANCPRLKVLGFADQATVPTSPRALQCLLGNPSIEHLDVTTTLWGTAIGAAIGRSDSCDSIKVLQLCTNSVEANQVEQLFSALNKRKKTLDRLTLEVRRGFSDFLIRSICSGLKQMPINPDGKCLHFELSEQENYRLLPRQHTISMQGFEAMYDLVKSNHQIDLGFGDAKTLNATATILNSIAMESTLNSSGRACLLDKTETCTIQEWLRVYEAMVESTRDCLRKISGEDQFLLSCIFELVKINPMIVVC